MISHSKDYNSLFGGANSKQPVHRNSDNEKVSNVCCIVEMSTYAAPVS